MHSSIHTPITRIALTTPSREPTSCQDNLKTVTTSVPSSSSVIYTLVSERINSSYTSGSNSEFRENNNEHQLDSPVVSNQCGKRIESKLEEDGSVQISSNPHILSNGHAISTSEPPQLTRRGEPDEDTSLTSYLHFLMIGVPIIVASILVCCVGLCWWNRRKMRKRGQEIPLDSVPPQAENENWPIR
ncbi:hypothetical protein DER45DRAFT_545153 [Fusarium avenaceum]|nr:hypothetical protein DER45DRAFT_545153 [Fusarium avenaceum]